MTAQVEELRKATPKSLCIKDLNALTQALDAQDLQEAKEEEEDPKNMFEDAAKIFRKVGKSQRKIIRKPPTPVKRSNSQLVSESTASASTIQNPLLTQENLRDAGDPRR